jgi:hypothetical protein
MGAGHNENKKDQEQKVEWDKLQEIKNADSMKTWK